MPQSPTHAEEAAAMRAFDAAMQRTEKLPLRGRKRVLAYVAGLVEEHQEEVATQLATAASNGHSVPAAHDVTAGAQ